MFIALKFKKGFIMNLKAEYDTLQTQVKMAMNNGQPIDNFVKRQIVILEQAKDEFVNESEKQGIKLESSIHRSSAELYYNAQLQALCKKIGLSDEKYKKQIDFIQGLFGD